MGVFTFVEKSVYVCGRFTFVGWFMFEGVTLNIKNVDELSLTQCCITTRQDSAFPQIECGHF